MAWVASAGTAYAAGEANLQTAGDVVALETQDEAAEQPTIVTASDITLSYGSASSSQASELSLMYAGKALTPTIKIQPDGTLLVEGTHYTTEFLGDKTSVGPQQVAISFTGGQFATEDSQPIVMTYNIVALDLSNTGMVTTSPSSSYASSYMYSGSRIEPSVTVNVNGEALSEDLFELSYPQECTDVNNTSTPYKIRISPKAGEGVESANVNLEKTRELSYNITKLNLASAYVASYQFGDAEAVVPTYSISSLAAQTYTGAEIKPSIELKTASNGTKISPDLYDIEYSQDCTNSGTVTMTITPKPNADGTWNAENITYNSSNNDPAAGITVKKTLTYNINKAQLNSDAVICDALPKATYTGKVIQPSVSGVKLGDVALEEGVDYEVSYGTNTAAGAGYVYLTGKGNFNDSSAYRKQLTFEIRPKSITSADVRADSVPDVSYTGSAHTPTPMVRDAATGKALSELTSENLYLYQGYGVTNGCDYYLQYSNNTNPGTAAVNIVGIGNYTGTRTLKFSIKGTGVCPKVKAKNKGGGAVKLTWEPIYKATKYMVLEKMPDGSYKTLSKSWTKTECAVGNLSTKRTHRFIVRAYVNGSWSPNSDKYLASVKPTGASKPKLRAASKSKSAVTLTWNAVPGADRYAIYEKVGARFQMLTNSYTQTSATINKLAKRGKYSFYVRACIEKKWTKAKKADIVTVSPSDPNPPRVKATGGVGKGKVKLTWDKARNAKKYKVEVKLANGKWKTLAKNRKKTSFTAKGLDASRSHTFRVRAFGNGKWSKAYSDYYVSAKPDNA